MEQREYNGNEWHTMGTDTRETCQHIPVDVADNGDHLGVDSENEELTTDEVDDEKDEKEYRVNTDKFHVSQTGNQKVRYNTRVCSTCNHQIKR